MPPLNRLVALTLALVAAEGELLPRALAQENPAGGTVVVQDTPPRPSPAEPPSMSSVSAPLKLELARRSLADFPTASAVPEPSPHPDGVMPPPHDVFVIGSPGIPHTVLWDPVTCRLLGVIAASGVDDKPSGGAPSSPHLLRATGPAPLSALGGAPRYFGFRLVGSIPEFLYSLGTLAIEERLWLDEGGTVLKQRFAVRETARDIQLTLPDEWRSLTTSSVGTWRKNVLSIPKESAGEVILSYRLTLTAPEPADPH